MVKYLLIIFSLLSISLKGAPFVEGYWVSGNNTTPVATIAKMNVDVIDIAFGTFIVLRGDRFKICGFHCDAKSLKEMISEAHKAKKKIKLSIGGAAYCLERFLQTQNDAIGMAQALSAFVDYHELDGVDFDIEDETPVHLQVSLIQETRKALGPDKIISYTAETPATSRWPWHEVIQLAHNYLTSITIMAYEYNHPYNYEKDVSTLLSWDIPSKKIVIGLMPGKDNLGTQTSIADIEGAAKYVLEKKLGGIMVWNLNRDHENKGGLGEDAATKAAWKVIHPKKSQ